MKLKKLQIFVLLLFLFCSGQTKAYEAVQWQESKNLTADQNGSVTSTSDNSYASTAYSIQSIKSGSIGFFEFTQRNMYGLIGLSENPVGTGYEMIDYAIQLWGGNDVHVVESNIQRGVKTTWETGDVFRISKEGSVISYLKNDVVFYTSTVAVTADLYVDFAFGLEGTGFDMPIIENSCTEAILWEEQTEVSVSSNSSITSTSDGSYASSAYSSQSISKMDDGYFEFTQRNMYGLVGLSSNPQGGGYQAINYAIQLWGGNDVHVVESNAQRGVKTSWQTGDVFRISKEGNTISYLKNGIPFYTSTVLVSTDLYADFAFGLEDTGFDNPVFGSNCQEISFWQEPVEITTKSDGSVTSTSDNSYASSAYSIQTIGSDKNGFFEFKQRNMYGLVGLSSNPQGGGYVNIDYAIQLWGGNDVHIVESNIQRGTKTTWKKGDVFRIQKTGNEITYLKNGTVFYTSTVATDNEDLYADFAYGLEGTGFDSPIIKETSVITSVDINNADILSVYPNPSTGIVNFSSPISGTVTLHSITGIEVYNENVINKSIITVDVEKGIYILSIQTANENKTINISIK